MSRRPKKKAVETTPYHASEELYQALFEQAADGIFIANAEGRYIEVNRRNCEMLGYTREEMLDLSIQELVPAEDLADDPLWLDDLRAGKIVLKERRLRTKDGCLLPVEISARMLSDGSLLGMVRDITERKRAEEVLRENEARYRAIVEAFDGLIYICSQDYRIEFMNKQLLERTGYDGSGELCYKVLHDRDSICPWCVNNQVFVGETVHWEVQSPKDKHWYYVVNTPIYHTDGSISKQAMILDITEHKRAEETLKEQHSTLHSIIDSTNALIFSVDKQYRYTGFNKGHAAVMKALYGAEIKIGHSLLDYMTVPEDRETARCNLDRVLAGEQFVEEAYSGEELRSRRYFQISHSPIKSEEGQVIGVAVLAQDMTERKRAERSIALMNFALDNVREAAFLIDENARFHYVNEESCRVLGYTHDELLGLSVVEVDPDFPAERWSSHWDELKTRRSLIFEGRHKTRDGRLVPVEISANYFEYDRQSYNLALVRDITERKKAEEEHLAHLRFWESMDQVNRAIQGTSELEQMMSDILDAVLSIFACDRASLVYPCDPKATSWRVPMERARPEYPGAHALEIEIPADADVAQTFRTLRASNGPVQFGPGSEYPLPAEVSQRFGFQSFIGMALYPKVGKPWEFVLHQCSYPRVWTPEEERLFREIGRRLADALSSLLAYRHLQESEERYRLIAENTVDTISVFDLNLKSIYVSPSVLKLRGYTVEEAMTQSLNQVLTPASLQIANKVLAEQIALEASGTADPTRTVLLELEEYCKDGSTIWVELAASSLRDNDLKPTGILTVTRDITERKQMAEALAAQEREFRTLAENSPDNIARYDLNCRTVYVNPALEKTLGRPASEMLGTTPIEAALIDESRKYQEKIAEVLKTGKEIEMDLVMPDKGEGVRYHNIRFVAERGADGAITGIQTIGRDVTERKLAEEALRRLNRELRAISNCNQILLRVVDEQALLTDICRVVCDEAGYRMAWVGYAEHDEARSVRPVAWAGVEDGYLATANITWADTEWGQGPTGTAIRSGESSCIQDFMTDPRIAPWREDALPRGYRSSIALPLKDENAVTFGVLNIYSSKPNAFTPDEIRLLEELAGDLAFGITTLRIRAEHKKAEMQILASEQLFRALVENSPDFIARYDREFRRVYVNPAIQKLFGRPAEDVLNQTPADQSPLYAPQVYIDQLRQVIETATERAVEMPFRTAQGEMHWGHMRFVPEFGPDGQVASVLAIGRDIHEIKENEQRFRTLAENFPDFVVRFDRDCRLTYVNPAVEKAFGLPAEAFLGKTLPELPQHKPEQDDALMALIRRAFDEGVPNNSEAYWDTQIGKRIFEIRHVPEKDATGNVVTVLGIAHDITERKRAEEEIRQLNQELEQRVFDRTAQLEATNKELEAFAYSVSHDLRAPLRHIDGFLELLQKRTAGTLDERGQHYMVTISDSAKRMGELIDDLLSFSRMGRHEMSKKSIDLGVLVQEIIQELAPETQGRTIHWRIADLPTVTGDRAMLRLVLNNLISNALKFSRGRPQADIEIGWLPGGKETIIFIRDNGVGFDMAYADKLFGVFQRLHRVDEFEGTGIGLANVRRIINRHGGRAWAEGAINRGATFYFSLPQRIQKA